jgi:hemerythrin
MYALHQDCVAMLVRLSSSVDREFKADYSSLIDKIEQVFRKEEQWMEDLDFPELKHHREQHAGILSTLHHGQARVMDDDLESGREIVTKLLPEWLLIHTTTMDAALANQLGQHRPN